MSLLATVSTEPAMSCSWWVANAVVPAAIAVLSSLLTILATLIVASRTDFYRRLSRWEPFGEQLRPRQLDLYVEICTSARKSMMATSDFVWNRKGGDEDRALRRPMVDAHYHLDELAIKASIMLASDFSFTLEKFNHQVWMFSGESPANVESLQFARKYSDEARRLYLDLVNSARTNVLADELNDRMRAAILESLPARKEAT